jgi:hypothetical protein
MRARLDRALLDNPTYLGEPHTQSAAWMDVCRHPSLLDAVEAVIGPDSPWILKPLSRHPGYFIRDSLYKIYRAASE